MIEISEIHRTIEQRVMLGQFFLPSVQNVVSSVYQLLNNISNHLGSIK